jgi:hypothetical protein
VITSIGEENDLHTDDTLHSSQLSRQQLVAEECIQTVFPNFRKMKERMPVFGRDSFPHSVLQLSAISPY